MKLILILLLSVFTYLNADEMQRIDSILKDISKLRSDYSNSQKKIKNLNNQLKLANKLLKTKDNLENNCKNNNIKIQTNSKNNLFIGLKKEKHSIAHTFRLNKKTIIFNNINGSRIYEWDNKTSFTSNIQSGNWIKITGYFINKVWTQASQNMWIKKSDTTLRTIK